MACRPAILDAAALLPGPAGSRCALFLDRDGVINVDRGYTHRREDFQLVEGVLDLCRAAVEAGHLVVLATNQAGIGRGYYSEVEFERFTRWMMGELWGLGVPVAAVYFCPHHPLAGVGPYREACPSRKPEPGMLLAARDDLALDLSACVLIGDKVSDLEAGYRAGVGRLVLLGTPKEPQLLPEGAVAVGTLREAREALFGSKA